MEIVSAAAQTVASEVRPCRKTEDGWKPLPDKDPPNGFVRVAGKLTPTPFTVEAAIRVILLHIGEDPDRNGLKDTPDRVLRALTEMTDGYKQDPARILSRIFDETHDEIIVVKAIPFTSLCEHHLLPFTGTVDIGYLPGKVVGLSKLARLVDCFSRRLQIQERLTREVAESIQVHLKAQGVGVVITADHSCLSCRGVRKPGTQMTTSVMLGIFRDVPEARAEFLSLCR